MFMVTSTHYQTCSLKHTLGSQNCDSTDKIYSAQKGPVSIGENTPYGKRVNVDPCPRAKLLENALTYAANNYICEQKDGNEIKDDLNRTLGYVHNSNHPTPEDIAQARANLHVFARHQDRLHNQKTIFKSLLGEADTMPVTSKTSDNINSLANYMHHNSASSGTTKHLAAQAPHLM